MAEGGFILGHIGAKLPYTTENGSFFIDFVALLKKTGGNTIYI